MINLKHVMGLEGHQIKMRNGIYLNVTYSQLNDINTNVSILEKRMINTLLYGIVNLIFVSVGFAVVIRQFPKKRYESKFALGILIIILIGLVLFEVWDATRGYIQTMQIVVNSFINAGILGIFFVCKYSDALLMQLFYNFSFAITKVPMLTLRGIWENKNLYLCNVKLYRIFPENFWCFAILLLALVLYVKKEQPISFLIKKALKKNRPILFIILFIEYLFLGGMMQLGIQTFNIQDLYLNISIVSCIALITLGGGIYLVYQSSVEEQSNLLIRQRLLEDEQNAIREYYEEDAQRLHDMKHVFLYLQVCVNEHDYHKAKKCLEQQLGELEQIEQRVWTGQAEIDFMVNHEHQKMEQKEIKFKLETEIYEVPIECTDFMVILGNLLDNAIEATEKCDSENRLICLSMKSVSNMFILEVKNSYRTEPVKRGIKLLTTKHQNGRHGWGLENVRLLVEKYNGDIQIEYEYGIFRVNILFYGR